MMDAEMIARLMRRPWNMSFEAIGDLDPWVIHNLLFWPVDDQGELIPLEEPRSPETRSQEPREAFRTWYRMRGFPEWQIDLFEASETNGRP